MNVRDVMTEPARTCTPETSLNVAVRLMAAADIGMLLVVDRHAQLVGVITDRDISLAVSRSNRNAMNIAVHEVMTRRVVTAQPDDDVHDALAAMKRARVRRLVVREAAGRVVGIVSLEDVVMRGLEAGGITQNQLLDALQAIYVRTPALVRSAGASR